MGGGAAGALLGCVCIILSVFVALFICSLILRASVWIANKCIGGSSSARSTYYDDDDDDYDNWDDYDRPARRGGRRRSGGSGGAIPEPSLMRGMGITFVVIIAQVVVGVVIFVVVSVGMGAGGGGPGFGGGGGGPGGGKFGRFGGGADVGTEIAMNCCSTIIGFFIWAGILSGMLPTSFARASLVTLFIHIILFVILAVVFGALVAVAGVGALK